MIDVSVIITTYNRLWCLPRAIHSCRSTKCNTEIIVVDDGSTDGTWEWLTKQPDIVPIRQANQGQTYAINNGVCLARGQYIRFLDSDDFLTEDIIDKQFQKAQTTDAHLVYSRVDCLDEKSDKITELPEVGTWEDFLEVQLSNRYGSHFLGMLFHRKIVEQVPRRPEFSFREDRMFLLEVGLLNPKTAMVEGCGGYWVKHQDQMQGNYLGLISQVTNWQHLNIYKKVLAELDRKGELTEQRKKAAITVLWPLAHWIAKNHLRESVDLVKWIYELDPGFKIPEKGVKGFLYKISGFIIAQKIMSFRRIFLNI